MAADWILWSAEVKSSETQEFIMSMVSSLSSVFTGLESAQLKNQVSVKVAKMALDQAAQQGQMLVNLIPDAPASSGASGSLGQIINTKA